MYISMSNTLYVAERLVATVGRAFYTDNFVLLLDTLVRERYIREEEFGPRLKLPMKEIRTILTQLEENEKLIRFEDLTMDDGRTSRCWYIDYQHFVHLIRLRVHYMQLSLQKSETQVLNHMYFECPSCQKRYTELEVQFQRSKDNKFICSNCCPSDNLRGCESQPYFTLIEHDNQEKLLRVQRMQRKLKEQLSVSEHHEGIFDLLSALRDEELPRNLPSENIKRGIGTSKITDEEVLKAVEENNQYRGKAQKNKIQSFVSRDATGAEIVIQLATEEQEETAQILPEAKKQKTLPDFLQGSRIHMSEAQMVASGQGITSSSSISVPSEAAADEDDENVEWED